MSAFDVSDTKLYVDSIGEVSLHSITLGDEENFFKIVAKRDITDKEFVQDILFHQLVTPKISKEEFEAIADEDLIKIARAFIEAEEYTFKGYTDTGNLFSDFRKIITLAVEEDERRFRETFDSSIKYIEQLTSAVKNIYIPNVDVKMLEFIHVNRLSGMVKELNRVLDIVATVNFQPLPDLLKENKKAIALYRTYWKNYYVLNEKITTNVFATFAAQNLLPQKDLSEEIQQASQLSIKNERIFTECIKEISSYPEEQRTLVYKKAGITFFSIDDFASILRKIKKTIEIHSQLMFWDARTKGELAGNLERIAQGHMMGLLFMGLPNKLVLSFQQLRSGSGIIDILLVFSNEYGELQKIILELKVFGEGHRLNDGIEQTKQYMENEETEHGFRVIFNATGGELEMQERLAKNGKTVKDIVININLPNPSL